MASPDPNSPDPSSASRKRRISGQFPNPFKKSKHDTANVGSSSRSEGSVPPNGFAVFKDVVSALKEVSDWMPPLKSAAAGLLLVLERIERVKGAPDELQEVVDKLRCFADTIRAHQNALGVPSSDREWFDMRLKDISQTIVEQTEHIKNLLDRGMLRRIVEAPADVAKISRFLRDINSIVSQFLGEMTSRINILAENINRNVQSVSEQASNIQNEVRAARASVDERAEADTLARLSQVPNKNECLAGTRTGVLDEILTWAQDPDSAHVYWLNGMAGTGKTTIALSVIRLLLEEHILGGWYLCSREGGLEERNVKNVLPKLSESLGSLFPAYRDARAAAFRDKPPLVNTLALVDQFDALFGEPLHKAYHAESAPPFVFVVDALDECHDHDATADFLRTVVENAPNSRVKFFVTSRPERHIRDELSVEYPEVLRLHDVAEDIVMSDIELYLRTELSRIASRRPELHSHTEWPPKTQVDILTEHADKLFIYASTALKYISAKDPRGRLERLTDPKTSVSPFAVRPIDGMYGLILNEAYTTLDPSSLERTDFSRCLSTLICARENLTLSSMANLLHMDTYRVRVALEAVHSMVLVPPDDDDYVATFHASFGDYLTDKERSGAHPWFVNAENTHLELSHACLSTMSSQLRFNIAGALTSAARNKEQTLNAIPGEVSYACRLWFDHILESSQRPDSDLWNQVETVMKSKYLYWLEVLSVLGDPCTGEVIEMLDAILEKKTIYQLKPALLDFLSDARTFLSDFEEPISESVAHIYISALPLTPPYSLVSQLNRRHFKERLLCLTDLLQTAKRDHAVVVVPRTVTFNLFSPYGPKVVLGSCQGEYTMDLWNVEDGEEVSKALTGHTDEITSVAVSPDETKVASGSNDCTIRVWDIVGGGVLLNVLKGHTQPVRCIAFSFDGAKIVSGSMDQTTRIWAVHSGDELFRVIQGDIEGVSSVAFSADGAKIVSGSFNCTMRVWNTASGEQLHKVLPGDFTVTSVTFWCDSTEIIIAGLSDRSIYVWNLKRGCTSKLDNTHKINNVEVLNGIVTSHILSDPSLDEFIDYTAISHSPHGAKVAFGRHDGQIRILPIDGEYSKRVHYSSGQSRVIQSLTFSPDGTKLAAGFQDGTIMIWDVESGDEHLCCSLNAKSCVSSIAFSPDGRRLASGHNDCTLRLWEVDSGEELFNAFAELAIILESGDHSDCTVRLRDIDEELLTCHFEAFLVHESSVMSVAYSPDGVKVATGTEDGTVWISDIKTGDNPTPLIWTNHTVDLVTFSPDGTEIASAYEFGHIVLWDIESGEKLGLFRKRFESIKSMVFSPDGNEIISGSDDARFGLSLWDVESGGEIPIRMIGGHAGPVNSVAISTNGMQIISGCQDGTVRVWSRMKEDMGPDGPLRDAKWEMHPDADWIVGPSGELILWIPQNLRGRLYWPGCEAILGRRMIHLNFTSFKHGESWTQCSSQSPRAASLR